jgi:hypothetical protein
MANLVVVVTTSVLATGIVLVAIAILPIVQIAFVVRSPRKTPLEVLSNLDLGQEMVAGALD